MSQVDQLRFNGLVFINTSKGTTQKKRLVTRCVESASAEARTGIVYSFDGSGYA